MRNLSILPIAFILSGAAFALSYLITPLTRGLSLVVGAKDTPDGKRKINKNEITRLGGVGFFTAFSLCLTLLTLHEGVDIGGSDTGFIPALLAGGAILAAGGISDDVAGLHPGVKLLLQTSAALVTMLFLPLPPTFSFFGLFSIPIYGVIGFFFVLFRLVFTINAVNFSDGLDGLASGLSVVSLISLSVFALINEKSLASAASLILAAAVLGFLPHNKYHAKLYMGDVGSQFLGLAIATLALSSTEDGSFSFETSLFLFVPMLDTVFSIARRIFSGKSPFSADKGHLHHILLAKGIAHPTAVKVLVAVSALVALVTLAFCI